MLKYFVSLSFLIISLHAVEQGYIIDKAQHLQWQDNSEADEAIWKMAVGYCKELKLAGHNDWRLASKEELVTLSKSDTIKEQFIYLEEQVYWSSEIDKDEDLNAITVFTGNGFTSSSDKCDKNFILCVREYKK